VERPYRLVIVRRDRLDVLRRTLESRQGWPAGTGIMLDRRRTERRVRALQVRTDRRASQRRAELDAAWFIYGFVVKEVSRLPAESAVLQPRGSSPDFGLRQPPTITGGATGRRAPLGRADAGRVRRALGR
jgi:hypothetical protein